MAESKSIHMNLAALCAVIAIVLSQSAGALTTGGSQGDNPFRNVNLQAEARTVDAFCDDLERFDKDVVIARRKTSLSHEEFNKLRERAGDLKTRWSRVQQAVRSAITKLKAANCWQNFDDLIEPRLFGDGSVRSFVRANGGLKRGLEQLVLIEIDPWFLDLDKSLRPKVATQVRGLGLDKEPFASEFSALRVGYEPPEPKFGDGLLCAGATIRLSISRAANETASPKASCYFTCRCISPDMGCAACEGL
jgi:hypothetical protein